MVLDEFKQAEREETDGAIAVQRSGEKILLEAVTNGVAESIHCSEHNASRLFAGLALILGIPLPKKIGKAIKL